MTEVRVRTDEDAKAVHFGEVPLKDAEFDEVIKLLRRWGIRSDVSEDGYGAGICGQFVLDDTGAYFEIVLCED